MNLRTNGHFSADCMTEELLISRVGMPDDWSCGSNQLALKALARGVL